MSTNRQGGKLAWEVNLKTTQRFDRTTNMRPRDKLKKLYLHFQKTYDH